MMPPREGPPMDRRGSRLGRRGFVAGCGRLPGQAQPATRLTRVSYLASGGRAANLRNLEAFRQGLEEVSWVEGQNLGMEYRFGEGRPETLPGLADDLVRLQPDVIVVGGSQATRAVEHATN